MSVPGSLDPSVRRQSLKERLDSDQPLLLPGASDPAGAMLIEAAGFDALYATGAGISNAQFGLPDIGLVSQTENVQQAGRICSAVDLPVIADADTGYGAIPSVIRTVQMFEQAGVAGIQLEDQVMPKRCGHFDGHELISMEQMQAKIAAATEARRDGNLIVIARTDARGVYGLDEAIRRGRGYLDAGADALFIEAPREPAEMRAVGEAFQGVPLVANMVEGGKTPPLSLSELTEMGFSIILYANFLMRAMLFAGQQALDHLRREGDSAGYLDRLLSWEDRQRMFGLSAYAEVEDRFLNDWGAR